MERKKERNGDGDNKKKGKCEREDGETIDKGEKFNTETDKREEGAQMK